MRLLLWLMENDATPKVTLGKLVVSVPVDYDASELLEVPPDLQGEADDVVRAVVASCEHPNRFKVPDRHVRRCWQCGDEQRVSHSCGNGG